MNPSNAKVPENLKAIVSLLELFARYKTFAAQNGRESELFSEFCVDSYYTL